MAECSVTVVDFYFRLINFQFKKGNTLWTLINLKEFPVIYQVKKRSFFDKNLVYYERFAHQIRGINDLELIYNVFGTIYHCFNRDKHNFVAATTLGILSA